MKISSRSRYALLTVLDLAMHRDSGVSKVQDIARRQRIPQKFLEQILLVLKSGGLVTSKRGAKGGYLLALEPEAITIAFVLKLTEDALLAVDDTPPDGAIQIFAEIWDVVNAHITKELSERTFADVLARAEQVLESTTWQYSI